jgi:hypothetical protein
MPASLRYTLLAILLLAAAWSLRSHRLFQGDTRVLTWDVYGYYLHLPAFLKYRDIREYAFVADHMRDYTPSDGPYQISRHGGIVTPTYTMGLAMLWLPLYGLADVWARADARYPADGLSNPYQWMIASGGLLALALGLWLLGAFLGRYLSWPTVAIVLAALGLGTNLFHYAAQEPGMPHVWLFALYAGLLLLLDRMLPSPRWWQGLLLGIILAVMALVRPTEALATLLLPALVWQRCGGWRGSVGHVRRHWLSYLWGFTAGILVLLPQLLLWKSTTGAWIFNPYAAAGHTFHFTRPYLLEGLFSWRKGWLVYTPVMALALAGLPLLWRGARPWAPGILLFTLLNIWIVLSWHIWWYAGSFGMRALVQSYAVLALPMGLFLEWAGRRSWWRDGALALILLFGLLNLFQTWQMKKGILRQDGMNKAFYLASFGRISPDRGLMRLLDIPDTPPRPPLTREPIASRVAGQGEEPHAWIGHLAGWPVKGEDAYSPGIDLWLSGEQASAWAGQWIELSAEVFAATDWAPYTQGGRLVLDVQREGRERHWYGLHLTRVAGIGSWWPVRYEVQLPGDLQAGDRITAYVWSTTTRDDLWVHRLDLHLLGF